MLSKANKFWFQWHVLFLFLFLFLWRFFSPRKCFYIFWLLRSTSTFCVHEQFPYDRTQKFFFKKHWKMTKKKSSLKKFHFLSLYCILSTLKKVIFCNVLLGIKYVDNASKMQSSFSRKLLLNFFFCLTQMLNGTI